MSIKTYAYVIFVSDSIYHVTPFTTLPVVLKLQISVVLIAHGRLIDFKRLRYASHLTIVAGYPHFDLEYERT